MKQENSEIGKKVLTDGLEPASTTEPLATLPCFEETI